MAVFERNERFVERLGAFAEEVLPKPGDDHTVA
jgi:hypothetical protein